MVFQKGFRLTKALLEEEKKNPQSFMLIMALIPYENCKDKEEEEKKETRVSLSKA